MFFTLILCERDIFVLYIISDFYPYYPYFHGLNSSIDMKIGDENGHQYVAGKKFISNIPSLGSPGSVRSRQTEKAKQDGKKLKTRKSFLYTASALCGAVIKIDCVSTFMAICDYRLLYRASEKLRNWKITDNQCVMHAVLNAVFDGQNQLFSSNFPV